MKKPKDKTQSNGVAELRRAYEDIVEANRQLDEENARLRELVKKHHGAKPVEVRVETISERQMTGAGAGPAGAKLNDAGQRAPASSGTGVGAGAPAPGQFIEYLPQGGKEGRIPQLATVLEVKPNGLLKIKVSKHARPDVVLDDVGPGRWRAKP